MKYSFLCKFQGRKLLLTSGETKLDFSKCGGTKEDRFKVFVLIKPIFSRKWGDTCPPQSLKSLPPEFFDDLSAGGNKYENIVNNILKRV